jgi:hypothetical protein
MTTVYNQMRDLLTKIEAELRVDDPMGIYDSVCEVLTAAKQAEMDTAPNFTTGDTGLDALLEQSVDLVMLGGNQDTGMMWKEALVAVTARLKSSGNPSAREVVLLDAIPEGWEVTHSGPCSDLTDEYNRESKIAVRRVLPPYEGADRCRIWSGPTLQDALAKAHQSLGMRYECNAHLRTKAIDAATKLSSQLHQLIGESRGVAGLHANGDLADWESLLKGGRFGEWLDGLADFDEVLTSLEIGKG